MSQVSIVRRAEDAGPLGPLRQSVWAGGWGHGCGLFFFFFYVGCPSCWHGPQEQGHLLLLGWLRCPRSEKATTGDDMWYDAHTVERLVAPILFFFFFFFFVEESLHAHRCQSYQRSERQIKQTTGECRVGSTSYDKGSCFSIA